MKEITLREINSLPNHIFEQLELEKLIISDSSIIVPKEIEKLVQLKELRFVGNINLVLPIEILKLKKTFILFENNQPEHIQLAGQLIFDYQRNKITESQAILYLQLLQGETIATHLQKELILALEYRIKEIRTAALANLDLLVAEITTIPEKSVLAILGKTESFTLADIAPRLKNLNISYQTKITTKTTHIIIAHEPNLKTEISSLPIITENVFFNWLNSVDKLFLSEKTDENKQAMENVIDMLNSTDITNVELAFEMMKTNGVSNELLTELLIFCNNSPHKTAIRKAKALFKKYGPKDFIDFLEKRNNRYLNTLEFYSGDESVYEWLIAHKVLDPLRIAFQLNKAIYFKYTSSLEKFRFLQDRIANDELDLSPFNFDATPHEVGQFTNLKTLKLGKNSKGINREENFPDEILQLTNLENLTINASHFLSLPDSIDKLVKLKNLTVRVDYYKKVKKTAIELKKSLLPSNCQVAIKEAE